MAELKNRSIRPQHLSSQTKGIDSETGLLKAPHLRGELDRRVNLPPFDETLSDYPVNPPPTMQDVRDMYDRFHPAKPLALPTDFTISSYRIERNRYLKIFFELPIAHKLRLPLVIQPKDGLRLR